MTTQKDKLRILFTHREMDIATYALAEGLAKLGRYEIFITKEQASNPQHSTEGISLLDIPPIKSKLEWRVIQQLRQYNKLYHFNLIFSPSSSGLSNAIIATLGTKTLNVGYRGTGAKVRRRDPSYYLSVLNPRLTHLVCETTHIQDYLRNFLPPSKLSVMTKPFDLAWIEAGKHKPIEVVPPAPDHMRLIYVGNSAGRPYKGLSTLFEAFGKCTDPRLSLIIVGDYDSQDHERATSLPNSQQIHFLGAQPGISCMVGADVYVLPSWRDASPRVLREAMALSMPTIVSDILGSRDLIVPNETGILAQAQDADDLARAIRWMLEHPHERKIMGAKGQAHLIKHYSP